MTHEGFGERLSRAVRRAGNPVVVGLDPRINQLPAGMLDGGAATDFSRAAAAFEQFCREIIDVVSSLVPVVKPQAAFFEQLGPPGMVALANVIAYARQMGLLVILDGKRNDIGSTAEAYADGWLGSQSPWGSDALTVSPYLGRDSLSPFVDVAHSRTAGVFVLVKTSNPGGGLIQDLEAAGRSVYRHVAALVESLNQGAAGESGYGHVGAVVGATYPEQLAELREAMPHTWILVPGYGAQGGTAADVAGAFDSRGLGGIVNSSRGIIFAHEMPEYRDRYGAAKWQRAVESATREMIQRLGEDTPAGRLVDGST